MSKKLIKIENNMCEKLDKIKFGPSVYIVYNPLKYARVLHEAFIYKYFDNCSKKILFLGMNPGPWGMCQTGIVFGDVNFVRQWMKLSGTIEKPEKEHPKKKIIGLDCQRNEMSGKKFWGLFKNLCGSSECFFKHAFIHNYCCLAFMDASGKNITPPEIKNINARNELRDICNETLVEIVREFKFDIIVGIGKFAEKNALSALKSKGMENVKVFGIPHPSPRSIKYFTNWEETTLKKLAEFNLLKYFNDSLLETDNLFRVKVESLSIPVDHHDG